MISSMFPLVRIGSGKGQIHTPHTSVKKEGMESLLEAVATAQEMREEVLPDDTNPEDELLSDDGDEGLSEDGEGAVDLHQETEPHPYTGSPHKSVETGGGDADRRGETLGTNDSVDDDRDDELHESQRRLRGVTGAFEMPKAGERISITYEAGEYHGSVFYVQGWKAGEAVVAFDDGDHHSFSKADLKRCAEAGKYRVVGPDDPLHGKGCVEGKESSMVGDIQLGKRRGGSPLVEGVWLGQMGLIGKEKLTAYESFVASEKSRVEFKTLMKGQVVRYGADKDSLGILCRLAKCAVDGTSDAKTRLVAIITPLAAALKGLLPSVTLEFLSSASTWQIAPVCKTFCVPNPDDPQKLPLELRTISTQLGVVTIGSEDYLSFKSDSPVMEQLEKAVSDHILPETLVRGQLNSKRKKPEGEPINLDSDAGSTVSGGAGRGRATGRGAAVGSDSRGSRGSRGSRVSGSSGGGDKRTEGGVGRMEDQERREWERRVRDMQAQMRQAKRDQERKLQEAQAGMRGNRTRDDNVGGGGGGGGAGEVSAGEKQLQEMVQRQEELIAQLVHKQKEQERAAELQLRAAEVQRMAELQRIATAGRAGAAHTETDLASTAYAASGPAATGHTATMHAGAGHTDTWNASTGHIAAGLAAAAHALPHIAPAQLQQLMQLQINAQPTQPRQPAPSQQSTFQLQQGGGGIFHSTTCRLWRTLPWRVEN